MGGLDWCLRICTLVLVDGKPLLNHQTTNPNHQLDGSSLVQGPATQLPTGVHPCFLFGTGFLKFPCGGLDCFEFGFEALVLEGNWKTTP